MEQGEGTLTKYVLTHPFLCFCQSHSSFLPSASPPKMTAVGWPPRCQAASKLPSTFSPGCLPHSPLLTTTWCNVFFAYVWSPNEGNRSSMEVEVAASEWQQNLLKQPIAFQLSNREWWGWPFGSHLRGLEWKMKNILFWVSGIQERKWTWVYDMGSKTTGGQIMEMPFKCCLFSCSIQSSWGIFQ